METLADLKCPFAKTLKSTI